MWIKLEDERFISTERQNNQRTIRSHQMLMNINTQKSNQFATEYSMGMNTCYDLEITQELLLPSQTHEKHKWQLTMTISELHKFTRNIRQNTWWYTNKNLQLSENLLKWTKLIIRHLRQFTITKISAIKNILKWIQVIVRILHLNWFTLQCKPMTTDKENIIKDSHKTVTIQN